MTKRIGIFDSGIGGVTVLKEILKVLPCENYLYYSDSKNNPYGDKDEEEIKNICDNIVKFLIEKECKAIVIACNTATVKAVDYLRKKYFYLPIIAIEPAYKMVFDFAYDKPTLIMATKGTIESEKFNLLYKKYNNHQTIILPCVGLANLIEEGSSAKIKAYLRKNLNIYRGKVINVVLGCTHYPLIKKEIKEILGPNIVFFNGASNLAQHLKAVLQTKNLLEDSKGEIEFIDSQNSFLKRKRFFDILNQEN